MASKRPTAFLRVSVGRVRRIEAGLLRAMSVAADAAERTGNVSMVNLNANLANLLHATRKMLARVEVPNNAPAQGGEVGRG